jgi:hypothetical protein
MKSPHIIARNLASILREDPIAASQIKEHIPAGDLARLLDIAPGLGSQRDDQLVLELQNRGFRVVISRP